MGIAIVCIWFIILCWPKCLEINDLIPCGDTYRAKMSIFSHFRLMRHTSGSDFNFMGRIAKLQGWKNCIVDEDLSNISLIYYIICFLLLNTKQKDVPKEDRNPRFLRFLHSMNSIERAVSVTLSSRLRQCRFLHRILFCGIVPTLLAPIQLWSL